ncbi:MAG: tetratricopeptide repeat protein, partial [Dolichospermum sp.]
MNKNIDFDVVNALHQQGLDHYHDGNYQQALANFDAALELYANFSMAYINRGNIFHILGNYEKAIADYNQCIKINPNFPEAYHNRGNSYYALQEYESAISNYNR